MVNLDDTNISQSAKNNAMNLPGLTGTNALISESDGVSQAMIEMNAHVNDMQPFIEAKNDIYDSLYLKTDIDNAKIQEYENIIPGLGQAIIAKNTNFLNKSLTQLENTIQGNQNQFQWAVNTIMGGIDRANQKEEQETNRALQIMNQAYQIGGAEALDGLPEEVRTRLEEYLDIGDVSAGARQKEARQKELEDRQFNLQEQQFRQSQAEFDIQQRFAEKKHADSMALQWHNATKPSPSPSPSPSNKKWGSYTNNSQGMTFKNKNGVVVPMYEWIANNTSGGQTNVWNNMISMLESSKAEWDQETAKDMRSVNTQDQGSIDSFVDSNWWLFEKR